MHKPKSVLVVDDNKTIRKCLEYQLSTCGYHVKAVTDGSEALFEVQESGKVDLIILDIMMPQLDGYQVLYQLRLHGYGDIPVILLSSKSEMRDITRGYNRGANLYITKPYNARVLMTAVEYFLGEYSDSDREIVAQELIAAPEVFLCAPGCPAL